MIVRKSMKDCQQAGMPCTPYTRIPFQCSRHELTDGKQPSHVKRQTKSGVYGCFFSPPFSYSASLCEQLLAGGSGETPAYSFLEYCRITLPSNRVHRLYDGEMIGRLPYLYFFFSPSVCRTTLDLEDCRIYTSFY